MTQEDGPYISNAVDLRDLGLEKESSKVSIGLSNILMAPEFSPK